MCIIPRSQTLWCAAHRGVRLCGVHPTAESSSAVCIIPQSLGSQLSQKTLQSASHRRVKLRGVLPNAESSSALCITLRSQAPRCASYQGVKLHGVMHTVESTCTQQSQNQNLWESLVAFKGTIRRIPFWGKLFCKKRFEETIFELPRLKIFELCDRISRRN